MIRLKFEEVIVFYEVPQVFVASDIFDTKYICLLYPADADYYKYLAVKISTRRLDAFKGATLDLLSIYTEPEDGTYYDVTVKGSTNISAEIITKEAVSSSMLPDEGFYCNYDAVDDDELIKLSMQKGKMMMCMAFSDNRNSHDIDVDVLAKALTSYKNMVRNCHIKLFGKQYADEAEMRACALQAASFDVHFTMNENFDLFGTPTHTAQTLKVINDIMSSGETDVLEEKVENVKGHTLNSMRTFLQLMEENQLTFRHKWVRSTLERQVEGSTIPLIKITKVHDYLNSRTELENVEVEFEGYFGSGSVLNSGNWTFIYDGNKQLHGKAENTAILQGITLGETAKYRIKCKETQTINPATYKPKSNYTLLEYKAM